MQAPSGSRGTVIKTRLEAALFGFCLITRCSVSLGSCYDDCAANPGAYWLCNNAVACSTCGAEYCPYLCDNCDESTTVLGGSSCDCSVITESCDNRCSSPPEDDNWDTICTSTDGCAGCIDDPAKSTRTCTNLCENCPAESGYGGLACNCNNISASQSPSEPPSEGPTDVSILDCFRDCYARPGKFWLCDVGGACATCGESACPYLCSNCPEESIYAGSGCDCASVQTECMDSCSAAPKAYPDIDDWDSEVCNTLLCNGCVEEWTCDKLCQYCALGSGYGGLSCECPTETTSEFPSLLPSTPPSADPTEIPSQSLSPSTLDPVALRVDPSIECFQGLSDQKVTSGDWWNYPQDNKFDWITRRVAFGPIDTTTNTMIGATLFSFTRGILKMSLILPPLHPTESHEAELVVTAVNSGSSVTTTCDVIPNIWLCSFRIEGLNPDAAYTYQVRYIRNPATPDVVDTYDGNIAAPVDNPRIIGLGCLGNDNTRDRGALANAVNAHSPHIVLYQGDQTYQQTELAYGFFENIYNLREITRSVHTITQMDDHDYGQGNIWGADFGDETSGEGFENPTCLVNYIQKLMMSHNPDPAVMATLDNGIDIYYTSYDYGRISFAILEARKFKSDERGDVDSLLGSGQEAWLQGWCNSNMEKIRITLTQTPFAGLATTVTANDGGLRDTGPSRDPNSNPKVARDRVMQILKDCSKLVLSGDQHLGIAVTYNIDGFEIGECASPAAINSVFWRMNYNTENQAHTDAFGNEYFLHKVWNVENDVAQNHDFPWQTNWKSDAIKNDRADGYLYLELNNMEATCQARSYRVSQDLVWGHTFALDVAQ